MVSSNDEISIYCRYWILFFFLFFWRTYVVSWGAHWYPCFGFLVTFLLGFKARVGSALFTFCLGKCNVHSLHMLTSWLPVSHPVTSPHASAEVGCGSDSNRQSPRQKTNALPFCQRPGYYLILSFSFLSLFLDGLDIQTYRLIDNQLKLQPTGF